VTTFGHEPLVDRPSVGRIFESTRRVRIADCSPSGRFRLDGCARYLQDVANDDARDSETPNPTAWVARRTVMRVDHFPQYLDSLTMATWCSGLGARWAERRYEVLVTGSAGRVEAATLWVHIDMETMRPIPVPTGFDDSYGRAAGGRTVRARLRLSATPPDHAETMGWSMRFTDFDVLGHANNAVYWAMVEEQLAARRALRAPLIVTLEHHDGIEPGDQVTVGVVHDEHGFGLWVTAASGRVGAVVRADALE
jgi:acyl-ACP thioesterase